ncbi:MAG: hypothetical protein AB7K64_09300 [Variibacter sp.]
MAGQEETRRRHATSHIPIASSSTCGCRIDKLSEADEDEPKDDFESVAHLLNTMKVMFEEKLEKIVALARTRQVRK